MKKSTGPTQTRQVVFNISQNFKVLKILGEGAMALLLWQYIYPQRLRWPSKIEPFERPLFCLRTLREIKLLTKFKNHDNIVRLYDVQNQ